MQLFAAVGTAQSGQRFLRLTIFVDDDGQENIEDQPRSTAITVGLATAVHQKAAPILVSSNTLRNFLIGQREFQDADLKRQFEEYLQLLDIYTDPTEEAFRIPAMFLLAHSFQHLCSNIPFTDAEWDVYQFRSMFLLIPKTYNEQIIRKTNTAAINNWKTSHESTPELSEIVLGFRLNNGEKKTITNLRQQAKGLSRTSRLSLSDVLVNGQGAPFGVWNITMAGHGMYAKNMQRGFTPTKDKPALMQYEEKGGSIAGISISDFRATLAFLAQNVDTNLLYYDSCFGGGMNTILPYVGLLQKAIDHYVSPVQPNFIVVSGALTDVSTLTNQHLLAHQVLGANKLWATPEAQVRGKNYSAFFDMLEAFFSQEKRVGTALSKSPLRDILKEISVVMPDPDDDPRGITSIPLIRFPGMPFFRAVDVDNRVVILTKALVTKHELENQPIEVHNKDAILFYTHAVRVPIRITDDRGKTPAFVPMIPGVIHHLKKLDVAAPLKVFLNNAAASLQLASTRKFVIGRLTTRSRATDTAPNIPEHYANVLLTMKAKNQPIAFYQRLSRQTGEPVGLIQASFVNGAWHEETIDEEQDGHLEFIRNHKQKVERESGVDLSAQLGAFKRVRTRKLSEQEVQERRAEVQKALQRLGDRPTPILRPTPEPAAKAAQPKKPTFLAMKRKPRRPKRPVFLQQRAARRAA